MKPVWLIGAGNVAWHLGHAFLKAGIPVAGVWSRNATKAKDLAGELNILPLSDLQDLSGKEGMTILAVPDQAIPEVIAFLPWTGLDRMMVLHTSGATPMSVFPPEQEGIGVFYPLQTLSKGRSIDFWDVPILLSFKSPESLQSMLSYAETLSGSVRVIDDRERAWYHLSAVFINNFIQHLGSRAMSTLRGRNLDRTLLLPLLEETVRKLEDPEPEKLQTGPALRGDLRTIHAHLRLMADDPSLARLYRQLSLSINPDLNL